MSKRQNLPSLHRGRRTEKGQLRLLLRMVYIWKRRNLTLGLGGLDTINGRFGRLVNSAQHGRRSAALLIPHWLHAFVEHDNIFLY